MDGGATNKPIDVHDWLEALFDESPVAIGFSRDGVMLDVNPAYLRLFGHESAAELRGGPLLDQIAPSHRPQVLEMITQRARGDHLPQRYQTRGLRKDGTEFPFEVSTMRTVVADGPLTIAFLSNVSEREDALSALKASEERFRTLSAAALEGVFVHAEGRIVLANEAGAAMYRFDPASMVGASLMDLTAPESRAVVAEHLRSGSSEPYEGIARRRDGTTFAAEVRGRTLSHQGRPTRVTIIRDITHRKRVEAEQRALAERVRQAHKLESLGVLAGGVAHDFNNILTVISNEIALARREVGLGAPFAGHLDAIALATRRAADLCRQMLAYAGKAKLEREPVELSALVDEMSSMLEASIAKKATLVRDLASGLPTLLGDATQIRQIVMNLVLNASEAIPGTRGSVRVSTGTGSYDAAAFARSAAGGEPKPGAYVWLEVEDDGVGMDAPTVAQMFDPFFTTKFVGRGLGMAAVLGIVRGHEGAIDVESWPGRGTRIRILLPARTKGPAGAMPRPADPLGGTGVVLIVDDERNVRISTQRLLRGFGFDVLTAQDGPEAIEIFRSESARIDAVLLDLTMPGIDGMETLKVLRSIAAEIPVILTSGYGLDDEPKRGDGPDAVLPKPYTAELLLATLRRMMSR
ncbi:MAG TPA: PAS domain S-box protein [Polyangiaceae bacterium]|jgi:PAS domain S-box-containing protein